MAATSGTSLDAYKSVAHNSSIAPETYFGLAAWLCNQPLGGDGGTEGDVLYLRYLRITGRYTRRVSPITAHNEK